MPNLLALVCSVGCLLWEAAALDIDVERYKSQISYSDSGCSDVPGHMSLQVLKDGKMCETSVCEKTNLGDYYRAECPTEPLKDYIASVFNGREFVVVEYSKNHACINGFDGLEAIVTDGGCYYGYTAPYDSTGVLKIKNYNDRHCTELLGEVGFTENDYQARQCRESANYSYTLAWSETFKRSMDPSTHASTDESNGTGKTGSVVGGTVVGCIVLVALIGLLIWRHKRKPGPKPTTNPVDDPVVAPSSWMSSWDDREFEHLRVNVGDLNEVEEIGTGGFAKVMLVRHSNGTYLAAKQLLRVREEQLRESFLREIRLNSRLSHPRIVKLIGVAWTSELDVRALFEYMKEGDLQRWLKATKHNAMERQWTRMKVQILLDIAEALYYAHSLERPIIHRDLKSSNVLLDERMRAKLADFGVSRPESVTGTVTAGVGTALWMAPEVVTGERSYTTSADIYSFGVVISEVDTHELPYHDAKNQHGQPLPSSAIPYQVKDGAIVPTLSATCPPSIANLARRCLSFEPNSRPTARTVVRELEDALREFV